MNNSLHAFLHEPHGSDWIWPSQLAGSLVLDIVRLKRYSIAEVHAQLKAGERLEQSETKSLCLFSFSTYFLELNSVEKVFLVMIWKGKEYVMKCFEK